MPRRPRIPSYRLHRASGQALVELPGGRRIYLGKHGTEASHEAYRRVLAEHLQGHVAPQGTIVKRLTVSELILTFWRFAEQYYRDPVDGKPTSELENYRQSLRVLRELYGSVPAADFGSLALQSVRQAMIDRGWSRGNINRCINRLKRVWRWGVSQELLPPDCWQRLAAVEGLRRGRSAAREPEPVRAVADEEVAPILPFLTSPVAAMVQLQRLCGARPGELVMMRGCDLDTTGEVWLFRPHRHKTGWRGHARVVFLGPEAQRILTPFLAEGTSYLFRPRQGREEHLAARRAQRKSPVTPSQRKRRRKATPRRAPSDRYTVGSYNRAIRRGCQRAGIAPWHAHQLRHAAGVAARRAGGLDAAQSLLGHRHARTSELYAELEAQRGIDVARQIG